MNNVKIDHVDNGYVVTITKFDFVNRRPEAVVLIFSTLDEVLAAVKEKF